MADLTDAQRKRAEGRQKRRSKDADGPADEPQSSSNDDGQEPHHAVKQAAKVAAAVGAAGAAAAAARALTSHGDEDEEQPEARDDDQPQAEPEAEPPRDEAEDQEPEEDEPQLKEQEREPVAGAGASDARKTIDRAREQLEDLLERPVESVSSLERTHDGWVVALEVVELKRIPDSTDVLASYEMELDDDLNLRRYQQVGRYNRSQATRGDGG